MDITLGNANLGASEREAVLDVVDSGTLKGGGPYDRKCRELMERAFDTERVFTTTSCTHALEMAALLLEIGRGDEVIVPSYTFPSTATAFAREGADITFCDVDPDTLNMDTGHLRSLVSEETACIVPVHYAGVACDMDAIMELSAEYGTPVVEDAAQGVNATHDGDQLGTIGDIGCFSFHETKDYSAGEGGAILLNDDSFVERAEIIRQKGTNYEQFARGEVDKYTWVDHGSSYVPSEMQTALIYEQLRKRDEIRAQRCRNFRTYVEELSPLERGGQLTLPERPPWAEANSHIMYVLVDGFEQREALSTYLHDQGIQAYSHYEPLHTSEMGQSYGYEPGDLPVTERVARTVLRLPVHEGLDETDIRFVADQVTAFFAG